MAILTSLFSGVSGLNANGSALSVVGDNIANSNTVGYKSSTVAFSDILSQTIGGGASGGGQIGRGVNLSAVTPQFTQGSFETTDSVLDMGIDGNGFFLVKDTTGTFYTRAGQFRTDKDGYIVTPEGAKLQGYTVSSTGSLTGSIGDLQLSTTSTAPVATSTATITANLDAAASVPVGAFSVSNPDTYNFSTSLTIYDSLGSDHTVTFYYVKTATARDWDMYYQIDGGAAAAGTDLVFATDGSLSTGGSQALSLTIAGGAATPQTVTFDFSGFTQYGAPSATTYLTQNGSSSGSLSSISIGQDGIITGLFSNGQTETLGQVALATFQSPVYLTKMGKNLYAESSDSGQPIVSTPMTGGKGRVLSNSLELSNTDLAAEFVKMITFQRGFQANSRIITTTDELLNELVNLKR
ncbi:MAG: flagellar hook protein FlgE [Nitrospirae bacterium]|nr:flagellar hook protein FlgE [Nitrospirota bacterium]